MSEGWLAYPTSCAEGCLSPIRVGIGDKYPTGRLVHTPADGPIIPVVDDGDPANEQSSPLQMMKSWRFEPWPKN